MTKGGAANKVYTIPIYLFPKLQFESIT